MGYLLNTSQKCFISGACSAIDYFLNIDGIKYDKTINGNLKSWFVRGFVIVLLLEMVDLIDQKLSGTSDDYKNKKWSDCSSKLDHFRYVYTKSFETLEAPFILTLKKLDGFCSAIFGIRTQVEVEEYIVDSYSNLADQLDFKLSEILRARVILHIAKVTKIELKCFILFQVFSFIGVRLKVPLFLGWARANKKIVPLLFFDVSINYFVKNISVLIILKNFVEKKIFFKRNWAGHLDMVMNEERRSEITNILKEANFSPA